MTRLLVGLLALLTFLAAAAPSEAAANRILSLGPALTEMCFALGLGPRVVGRTSYCNYPPAAAKVPAVGAVTGWNEELVLGLRPDLILAVEGDRAPVERLARLTGAKLHVLPTRGVADVWANMTTIGRLAGVGPRAAAQVTALKARLVARRRPPAARPTAFYMVWDEPLMAAGPSSYLGELITLAGARNVVPATAAGSYPPFSWEALLAADPDVILAPRDRGPALARLRSRYPGLQAVRAGHMRTLPDDLISRPGPRVVEALDAVIAAIQPARPTR